MFGILYRRCYIVNLLSFVLLQNNVRMTDAILEDMWQQQTNSTHPEGNGENATRAYDKDEENLFRFSDMGFGGSADLVMAFQVINRHNITYNTM